ncbi:MAG: PilZ domain-containing protein [Magnetococcus sp. DMHC-6]
MTETIKKNNPLFATFGEHVNQFFATHDTKADATISLGLKPSQLDEEGSTTSTSAMQELIDPQAQVKIQTTVNTIRQLLISRKGTPDPQKEIPSQNAATLDQHLRDFRHGLANGEESSLTGNPFYELTKLVFYQNLKALTHLFRIKLADTLYALPQPVSISRSLRNIWGGPSTFGGTLPKIIETLGIGVASGRVPLALLLFIGSSYTTARGMNDLLQMPALSEWTGGILDGQESESWRYTLCLIVGFILSSAILDFKGRILQAIAETGRIFKGINTAFGRNPRWMILAALLTLVSIKTNYDGIVSILSKKGDLDQQSQLIRERVIAALGKANERDATNPDSLRDLQATLAANTQTIQKIFLRLPEDEVSGVATSQIARKGPRYWAKHFIVFGGYEPGINDVVLTSSTSDLSRQIDAMLFNSGIDFSTSYAQKVDTLVRRYNDTLARNIIRVHNYLNQLDELMVIHSIRLADIKRFISLEHYQINDIVQSIIDALEENKKIYKEVASDLRDLTNAYLTILLEVDKSGTATLSSYRIEAEITVPRIDAIDQLRDGKIPTATHKNFAELRLFLIQQYGTATGGFLLSLLLFLSIAMDLGDPLLYARSTKRLGIRDRALFTNRLIELMEWENQFLNTASHFFTLPEVKAIFLGITPPSKTGIRDSFYKYMEKMDPFLKDPNDKTIFQSVNHWFHGLFKTTRTQQMEGYNARIETIRTFLRHLDRHAAQLIQNIYPGIPVKTGLRDITFKEAYTATETGIIAFRKQFFQELENTLGEEGGFVGTKINESAKEQQKLTRHLRSLGQENFQFNFITLHKLFIQIFHSNLRDEFPAFPHTRRQWIQSLARSCGFGGRCAEALYEFVPTLQETLFITIPTIKFEILQPLRDIRNRFPDFFREQNISDPDALVKELNEVEERSFLMWGVTKFRHDQESDQYSGVLPIIDPEGIVQLTRQLEDKKSPTICAEKIRSISLRANEALAAAQAIESRVIDEMNGMLSNIQDACSEVSQSIMKIKMQEWEYRKTSQNNKNLLMAIPANRDFLNNAPEEMDALLSQLEEILQLESPYTQENHTILSKIKKQSDALRQRSRQILVPDEPPIVVDRRHALTPEQLDPSTLDTLLQTDSTNRRDDDFSSRRLWERTPHQTKALFEMSNGKYLTGTTKDVSLNGLNLRTDTLLPPLQAGDEGNLMLMSDPEKNLFPVLIVRVQKKELALRLINQEALFEHVIAQDVLHAPHSSAIHS